MIFFGNGKVWDARRGGVLCRFVDGKADITDRGEIAYLIKRGYAHEPIDYRDQAPAEVAETAEPTKEQLLEIATEMGIEVDRRWGPARIQRAIEEAEGVERKID